MGELSEFDEPEAADETDVTDVLQSVFDKPIVRNEKQKVQREAQYRQLAADTRALPMRQRLFLRHLLSNQMRPVVSLRKMNADSPAEHRVLQNTALRWMMNPHFKSIIERYTQLLLDHSGVGSPATTLLRIDALVEDALIPEPIVGRDGQIVGHSADRSTAMKGLELLGKAAGAFRKDEEASQRVTVVLDFSGEQMQGTQESEIIEGEATEIAK